MLRVVSHALATSQCRSPRRGARVLQIHGCFAWARAQVACVTEPFRRKDLRRSQLRATWFRESRGALLRILGGDTLFINSAFRFEKKFRTQKLFLVSTSVASETRNSGVTIMGTKNPAAVLNNRMRACRRTFARCPKFQVTK